MTSRREFLAAGTVAIGACAGCLDDPRVAEIVDRSTTVRDTETDSANRIRIAVSDGDGERDLVTGDDVASVGEAEKSRHGGYRVPVTLTDDGTESFTGGLERVGAFDDPTAHEIRIYVDGERVNTATLGRDLADRMENGEWDGRFVVHVADREAAERLREALDG